MPSSGSGAGRAISGNGAKQGQLEYYSNGDDDAKRKRKEKATGKAKRKKGNFKI
jgi:hypothetical protein